MRRSYFRLLEGVLFSLPLLFASCGNGDNALEEIINGGGSGGGSGTVTAATITTAPTATAGDILAGSTTALVTAGVADGGTLMYKATSDNTQPTSTDGFSVEIPTAATNTAGTYYIWYYAKAADAQHTDSEIAATPVKVSLQPTLSTPLTVEAITAGTITVTSPKSGMKYSNDGGVTKKNITTDPIPVAAGDKVEFYGTATSYSGTKIGGADEGGTFKCKVYGNIMSLLYEDFATKTELPADDTFLNLFSANAKLTDASGLLLPATTLKQACYVGMFAGCTALTTAPAELPATDLTDNCYFIMFLGCKALTETPKLPATELKNNCYMGMFDNCTSLTTAYVKAAYTTTNDECSNMFNGCTATGAKTLHTTTASKTSWEGVMPSTWAGWTAIDDWTD